MRPRSRRSLDDEMLGGQVRNSFIASDRTYGARRVWHDVLELGRRCGLHRIERLMRAQALRARPKRRGLPKDVGERNAIADNVLDRQYTREHFRKLLTEQGITCSLSRAGEIWDNSAMESFFSSLKTERTARMVYCSREPGPLRRVRLHRALLPPTAPALDARLRQSA